MSNRNASQAKEGSMAKREMLDLRVGTVVESKHHGRGTCVGGNQIKFNGWKADKKTKRAAWAGATLTYSPDGRYFTNGEFEDKKPVLTIVSQPTEGEVRK